MGNSALYRTVKNPWNILTWFLFRWILFHRSSFLGHRRFWEAEWRIITCRWRCIPGHCDLKKGKAMNGNAQRIIHIFTFCYINFEIETKLCFATEFNSFLGKANIKKTENCQKTKWDVKRHQWRSISITRFINADQKWHGFKANTVTVHKARILLTKDS